MRGEGLNRVYYITIHRRYIEKPSGGRRQVFIGDKDNGFQTSVYVGAKLTIFFINSFPAIVPNMAHFAW